MKVGAAKVPKSLTVQLATTDHADTVDLRFDCSMQRLVERRCPVDLSGKPVLGVARDDDVDALRRRR